MADPKPRARKDRRTPASRAPVADDSRTRLIRAIRAACRRQQIDDDTRKAIQCERIGKASMSDMTLPELGRLLDHFNRHWSGPMGHRAHIGKIKALWWTLYWLGAVADPGDHAISAFVERQTGISALKFLDHTRAAAVIEALKSWAGRAGVIWPTSEQVADHARYWPGHNAAAAERMAVLEALARELRQRGLMFGDYSVYLSSALQIGQNSNCWSPAELDAGIRLLGRKLRRAAAGES